MKAGRELDALVAEKVMGGFVVNPNDMADAGEVWYWLDPRNGVLCGVPYKVGVMTRWDHQWHDWKPSTDIAHAWQVVERFLIPLDTEDAYHLKHSFWYYLKEGSNSPLFAWPADKAARIICRAALSAVGIEA